MQDLALIYQYIVRDNRTAAAKIVREINGKLQWAADAGCSGAPRDAIRHGLRAMHPKAYVIYYDISPEALIVLRVIHQRRDISTVRFDQLPVASMRIPGA